ALTVTRSRFEAGRGGHYVKSRAGQIAVLNSSFDDSGGKATNYMIDLPAGASGRIAGNWFVQGRDKENYSAFIAVAAEGKVNSSAGLQIEANDARFAPGVTRASVFVADWSGDRLAIGANALGSGLTRFEKR
ncbi:MAG: right-handed parallel beta-helix repeat-containing protein, partial [Novosphingobium sp.]